MSNASLAIGLVLVSVGFIGAGLIHNEAQMISAAIMMGSFTIALRIKP